LDLFDSQVWLLILWRTNRFYALRRVALDESFALCPCKYRLERCQVVLRGLCAQPFLLQEECPVGVNEALVNVDKRSIARVLSKVLQALWQVHFLVVLRGDFFRVLDERHFRAYGVNELVPPRRDLQLSLAADLFSQCPCFALPLPVSWQGKVQSFEAPLSVQANIQVKVLLLASKSNFYTHFCPLIEGSICYVYASNMLREHGKTRSNRRQERKSEEVMQYTYLLVK